MKERLMHKRRRSWQSLALAAGLSFGIVSGQAATAAGTLNYGIASDIQHFDPALLPAVNFPIMPQLFDSVIRLDDNTQPQPALAESWEFGADGLSLTLHLRKDVVYHDGSPLTASDIDWNITRYKDPATAANARVMYLAIDSTEIVDEHTIVLKFKAPQAAIFDGLDLLYITKPTTDLEGIRSKPVGTGPFKLDNRAPGDSVTLVRNDAYWNADLPHLDRVNIRVLPDSLSGIVALETGEIDMLGTPPADELDRLAGLDGITVLQAGSPSVVSDLMINVAADSPFSNKLVRQAVHHAVDRQRIVGVAYAGHSETWCLPWHSGSIAFTPAARECPRDLDKARALLAEAGFPSGFSTTLMSGASESNVLLAQILASNLAEIGITANIEQVEVPQQRWGNSDFVISVHGYGRANRDPSSLLNTTSVFRPINNFSKYESEDYKTLVTQIGTTLDIEARKAFLAQLDTLMLDEMWVVSIAPTFIAYAHSDKVKGLRANLDGMPFLENVTLD